MLSAERRPCLRLRQALGKNAVIFVGVGVGGDDDAPLLLLPLLPLLLLLLLLPGRFLGGGGGGGGRTGDDGGDVFVFVFFGGGRWAVLVCGDGEAVRERGNGGRSGRAGVGRDPRRDPGRWAGLLTWCGGSTISTSLSLSPACVFGGGDGDARRLRLRGGEGWRVGDAVGDVCACCLAKSASRPSLRCEMGSTNVGDSALTLLTSLGTG